MRDGFRLGRLFGIELHVDWSLLLIFFLITWNLSSGFASIHSDWGALLTWGTAVLAAILFFGSVLVHELAHSLVARSQGLPVRRITLFLFGGVSNIQREPPSPISEFLIAIVGPISSILLGAAFIAVSGVSAQTLMPGAGQTNMDVLRGLGPLSTLLLWLGPINIVLGIFNLVPGFPLDGGRIVRSILWALTDNLRRATRLASYLGQGVAWLMIGSGFAMVFGIRIPFFGTGLVSGLWLAFIGWFLHSAATRSYQQVVIRDLLEDVPVSSMMRDDTPSVAPDLTVNQLVNDHFMRSDHQAFPVIEGGKLVGLVGMEDVRSVPRDGWGSKLTRDIMRSTSDLAAVGPNEDAADALDMLRQREARQLLVLRNGSELVGLLRPQDIMRWLQLHSDAVAA